VTAAERLLEIVRELEALRDRLGEPGVEPAEATALLERISRLAQEAAEDLEERAAAAEREPGA
jgi:hypothetical protein